jgi:hypothetical protein
MLTGIDFAADLRGTYATALEAKRIVDSRGGVMAIASAVCDAQGWPVCPVAKAGRGDVVAIESEHGPALGVCLGADSAFAGNIYRSTLDCGRAWRVL